MMSYYEARRLDQLERDLRKDSPQLARQFERFGFRLVLLRLMATAIGTTVVVTYMCVEKSIDAVMLGSGILAMFGWELHRRAVQLRRLPRPGRLTALRRQD